MATSDQGSGAGAQPSLSSHPDVPLSEWASTPNRKLTSEDRVIRNRALVAMRIRRPDIGWEGLGLVFGVTDRGARKIWAEWRDSDREELKDEDPVDVIHEHIAGYRDLRAQAAVLAAKTKQDAVLLGCLKTIAELRAREIALRQETGLLPHDLGRIAVDLDLRFVVDRVTELLVKHKVPKSEIAELIAVLDGEVTAQTILASARADDE